MMEAMNSNERNGSSAKATEARYAYYRRCQIVRRCGEQCKAPAEKGSQICHAHAGQMGMALRRERGRQAVLAEAVAVMRRKGRAEYETKDLLTDFNGIQVTLAVAAQALIDGRIDCKTAGRLGWQLQTMLKILRLYQRGKALTTKGAKEREGRLPKSPELPKLSIEGKDRGIERFLPQICADERRSNEKDKPRPRVAAVVVMTRVEKTNITHENLRHASMNVPPGWARAA
jgi:hypothetical protein